jgi:adenine-specific DNA-methyltransferase
MNGNSFNIRDGQLKRLSSLFPDVLSEGKIDFEKLKLTLGEDLTIADERYILNWAGKSDAFRAIQMPTTATLKPQIDDSVNFETTDNLFIEGENLEVLKVLQKSYYNKVKMIYIDPPYNTGNDNFIYPDKFSETKEEYLKRIGEMDEEGYLTKERLFRKNSKESGRYHSNWLSMIYPRLFLARNLLRDDGVIFVSIDDNEVHNLRLLMNEIFGEENFVASMTVLCNPKGRSQDKYFATNHEYILVYSKSNLPKGSFSIAKDEEQIIDEYPEEDDLGKYRLLELRNTHREFGRHNRRNLYYPLYVDEDGDVRIDAMDGTEEVLPIWDDEFEGCWTWEKPKAEKDLALLVAQKIKGRWKIFRKSYASGADRMLKTVLIDNTFYTERGQKEFNRLFGTRAKIFQSPKSPLLLSQLIKTATEEGDIILDFFAGSGTTAQAVLELNKEDGGNRKFILVQLPEKTDEESEAYKAGYKTIAEICKERIRRVIKRMSEPLMTADDADKNDKKGKQGELSLHGVVAAPFMGASTENADMKSAATGNADLGFKVFRLEQSNFKIWRTDTIENEEDLKNQMDAFADPVKASSTEENMAWEILLKSGYELTAKLETLTIQGVPVYNTAGGEMMLALNSINEKVIDKIIKRKPKQFICLDKLFNGNDQLKTNTVLQMRDAGIGFETI